MSNRWTLADVEKIGLDRLVRPPVKTISASPRTHSPRQAHKPIQPEAPIQKAILAYLRAKGVLCWKNRAVGIQKPNGSFIPIPEQERGVSDIIGILPGGRLLAVEVKRDGKEPTDNQRIFLERVNQQGGLGFVARSIDDCQQHGI